MTLFYFIMVGLIVLFGASALYALYWAANTGQFENIGQDAEMIFDDKEPIGRPTDSFPGETWQPKKKAKKSKKGLFR